MNNTTNINQENQNISQQNSDTVLKPITPIAVVDTEVSDNTSSVNQIQPENNNTTQSQLSTNKEIKIQNELQNIPTVEQDTQAFINNVQSMNVEKKEEKKEGVNFVFIIVLFIIILSTILFLFPILLDYI